jgi:hypothetical protein
VGVPSALAQEFSAKPPDFGRIFVFSVVAPAMLFSSVLVPNLSGINARSVSGPGTIAFAPSGGQNRHRTRGLNRLACEILDEQIAHGSPGFNAIIESAKEVLSPHANRRGNDVPLDLTKGCISVANAQRLWHGDGTETVNIPFGLWPVLESRRTAR